MPKISIVMPSLNVGKYITACMESVVHQSFSDIEIIVVDAGSTDGTLEILKDFAEKDSRIILVNSDKRSYGYQMNLGISMAKGEYIGIVETDDLISSDMFEILYDRIRGTDAQYIKACANEFYEVEGQRKCERLIRSCTILPLNSWVNKITVIPKDNPFLFWDDNFLWYGMYRADFLKQIHFNETPGAAFQDIGALFQIISKASKGIYINDVVYYYRKSNGEASSYNPKSFNFAYTEYENIYPYLKDLSDEWKYIYYRKMLGLYMNRFFFMAASGKYWEESEPGIKGLTEKIKKAFADNILTENNITEDNKKRLPLINDSRALYQYEYDRLNKEKEPYEVIRNACENKKVVIFGAGMYGGFIHTYLSLKTDCKILGYMDNSKEKWGTEFEGEVVMNPQECDKLDADTVYLIANKRYSAEIRQQLLDAGKSEDKIVIYDEKPKTDILMYN